LFGMLATSTTAGASSTAPCPLRQTPLYAKCLVRFLILVAVCAVRCWAAGWSMHVKSGGVGRVPAHTGAGPFRGLVSTLNPKPYRPRLRAAPAVLRVPCACLCQGSELMARQSASGRKRCNSDTKRFPCWPGIRSRCGGKRGTAITMKPTCPTTLSPTSCSAS
jgi:hypothetical protein